MDPYGCEGAVQKAEDDRAGGLKGTAEGFRVFGFRV